jgi:hypothetical protein
MSNDAEILRFWESTSISKEDLDRIPELPNRVDFDDWQKQRGLVNLLSEKKNKPWLRGGFYKKIKGGKLCVLQVAPSVKGVSQTVWLERPKIRVKANIRPAGPARADGRSES